MARKQSQTLTSGEARLMEVVWCRGAVSVNDIKEILDQTDQPIAYNTIQTVLNILKNKGYLQHVKEGRQYVYQAVVARDAARQSALQEILSRFFDDSPRVLLSNLLKNELIDKDEIKALKKLISDSEKGK